MTTRQTPTPDPWHHLYFTLKQLMDAYPAEAALPALHWQDIRQHVEAIDEALFDDWWERTQQEKHV